MMSKPEDTPKSDLEKEEEVRIQVDLKLIMNRKYLTRKYSYNLKIKVINVSVFYFSCSSPTLKYKLQL